MKTLKTRVAPYLMLLFVLSLGNGAASAAPAQSPLQASVHPLSGRVYSQSDSGAQIPASARNNSPGGLIHDEWKSLPAPYSRSLAELNDMRSYVAAPLSDAQAHQVWKQEARPFSRSVYELNALKRGF